MTGPSGIDLAGRIYPKHELSSLAGTGNARLGSKRYGGGATCSALYIDADWGGCRLEDLRMIHGNQGLDRLSQWTRCLALMRPGTGCAIREPEKG
jgi:hypothetical protein